MILRKLKRLKKSDYFKVAILTPKYLYTTTNYIIYGKRNKIYRTRI